jgi:hypothetical protein
MLALLLFAATQMAPPPEPLAGKIRAAIWGDLELNGMIGNGNEVAWRWMNYFGSPNNAPRLHILGLVCRGGNDKQHCRFEMLREGGAIVVDGRQTPDRIRCSTTIRPAPDENREWSIPHLPPGPSGGHSRTTMKCRWAGS